MPQIASKLTHVTLAADRVIESGNSIRVSGILISNPTDSSRLIVFRNSDSKIILEITVGVADTISWDVMWMADKGLYIDSETVDVTVTVAHSAAGA